VNSSAMRFYCRNAVDVDACGTVSKLFETFLKEMYFKLESSVGTHTLRHAFHGVVNLNKFEINQIRSKENERISCKFVLIRFIFY
jgi:hypothetical protein